jgi:hypothetical protein
MSKRPVGGSPLASGGAKRNNFVQSIKKKVELEKGASSNK